MAEQNGAGLAETQQITQLENSLELLQESYSRLEQELYAEGWRSISQASEIEFSRDGLKQIADLSRIMAVKNPLVKRGVQVYSLYVWGQGVQYGAQDDDIEAVLHSFMDQLKNKAEFTSHQARTDKERVLMTDGNIFFVPITDQISGQVVLRTIPFNEINTVICNPDDAKDPWYYRRTRTVVKDFASGIPTYDTEIVYHPDWRYNPVDQMQTIDGDPILWDQPVYHVKIGAYPEWSFGIGDVYTSIDWAIWYKNFLADWSSIVRAYRRFAFQATVQGGARGVAAAKSKLNTTYGTDSNETNPPPVTGSTFIAQEGTSIKAIPHSNATVKAEDGRRLLLMVCAAFGLPETFFGDTSVGSLATAKSLDRPTELAMLDRQSLWRDVHAQLFDYVILQAVKAPQGALRSLGRVVETVVNGEWVETIEWGADVDPQVWIEFPPLISDDVTERIDAIVSGATLDGKELSGTMPLPLVSRLVLSALGVDNVDEIVTELFPDGEAPEDNSRQDDAVESIREALAVFAGKLEAIRGTA